MRETVRAATVVALLAFSSPSIARAQTEDETTVRVDWSEKIHLIGIRCDWGSTSSYGIFYAHTWASGHTTDGLGPGIHGSLGAALTVHTESHSTIDAVSLGPLFRGGIFGDAMAFGGEAHAAVSLDDEGVDGFAVLSALVDAIYFGIGYSYYFPLEPFGDRPTWMHPHRFALRGAAPVRRYDVREERTVTAVE